MRSPANSWIRGFGMNEIWFNMNEWVRWMHEDLLSVSGEERLDFIKWQKAIELKLFSIPKGHNIGFDFWIPCKLLTLRRGLLPGEKHSYVIEEWGITVQWLLNCIMCGNICSVNHPSHKNTWDRDQDHPCQSTPYTQNIACNEKGVSLKCTVMQFLVLFKSASFFHWAWKRWGHD